MAQMSNLSKNKNSISNSLKESTQELSAKEEPEEIQMKIFDCDS